MELKLVSRVDDMATDMSGYDEIWLTTEDGQSMCALINGNVGWLMYLRGDSDAGFSSRNPEYVGPPDAQIDYYLNNGQRDEYPLAWALPIDQIRQAIDYFKREQKPPPFITWYNDSGDGKSISGERDTGQRRRREM